MSQIIKIWEIVVKSRLRRETSISEAQFCFMTGKGTYGSSERNEKERICKMKRIVNAVLSI